jgi:hypothetical protein
LNKVEGFSDDPVGAGRGLVRQEQGEAFEEDYRV